MQKESARKSLCRKPRTQTSQLAQTIVDCSDAMGCGSITVKDVVTAKTYRGNIRALAILLLTHCPKEAVSWAREYLD